MTATESDARPVLVAFDGSDASRAAVSAAATLFPARRLVVVSVWEPGLALAMASLQDTMGVGYALPSAEEMVAVDRAQQDHARDAAEAGAMIARQLGATAQALAVADDAQVAETIATAAARCDACAVVVGSRGLGGVKAHLAGSTSRSLLQRADRPVLVVKAPE